MSRIDYGWVILCAGFAALFVNSGSRMAFGLLLKPMTEDLGWSRSSLSLAATTFFCVSALTMPLLGRLVDRYSLRAVMGVTALTGAVGIGLMAFAASRWQVFALYGLVYAAGSAGSSVSMVGVLVSRWFAHRRGLANSAAISGNAVGQLVIITLLASFLESLRWRGAYLALGAANLALAPLMLALVRSRPPEARGGAEQAARVAPAEAQTAPGSGRSAALAPDVASGGRVRDMRLPGLLRGDARRRLRRRQGRLAGAGRQPAGRDGASGYVRRARFRRAGRQARRGPANAPELHRARRHIRDRPAVPDHAGRGRVRRAVRLHPF